jgi:hypothetical protein
VWFSKRRPVALDSGDTGEPSPPPAAIEPMQTIDESAGQTSARKSQTP